ncbi:28167_t:CDS:2, partial [Racocetra persica]
SEQLLFEQDDEEVLYVAAITRSVFTTTTAFVLTTRIKYHMVQYLLANTIVDEELAQKPYNDEHASTNLDSGHKPNTTSLSQSNLMIFSQEKQDDLF